MDGVPLSRHFYSSGIEILSEERVAEYGTALRESVASPSGHIEEESTSIFA